MNSIYKFFYMAVIIPTLCLAPTSTEPVAKNFDEIVHTWLRTFAEVLHLAESKHYKVVNAEAAMIKAIDAFLSELDPHSSFLDPKTYGALLESTMGEFYGIGVVIDNTRKLKDKFLTLVDTIPGGPADKSLALKTHIKTNIQPLDKIIEIDGLPLEGMSTEEATAKIKGQRGTKVTLKILRDNLPDLLTFEVVRDIVKEHNSISFYIKEQNIYYIALSTFSQNGTIQIEQLLKKAQGKPYKGLILDLRNNSGGLLLSAIDIAGLFLPKNSLVVVTKDKNNKEIESYHTVRDPIPLKDIPIVVLINNFTASAAEILAKILKEYAQANKMQNNLVFLVGTQSFEKGSVQEIIPVSNNCAVRLTTSLYFPNNKNIQGEGVKPDIIIEKTTPPSEQLQWFTKYYGREHLLTNTIKTTVETKNEKINIPELQPTKQQSAKWADRIKEMLQTDNQLRESINIISLIDTLKQVCPEKINSYSKAVTLLQQIHVPTDQLTIEEVSPTQ